eukprot:TRINITY_DN13657_c0_g1_i1.p1 TRINITY_DN13657_c0_g1~~TRINITY_DN13657_c0_g1_i1.p1  ORF type:complete len:935 (-),score=253.92 TRINITY_DN13657_c0_g1_i1:83-2887(-)
MPPLTGPKAFVPDRPGVFASETAPLTPQVETQLLRNAIASRADADMALSLVPANGGQVASEMGLRASQPIALEEPPAADASILPPPPDECDVSQKKTVQQIVESNRAQIPSILKMDDVGKDIKDIAGGDNDMVRMLRAAARAGNAKDKKVVPREEVIAFLEDERRRRNACLQIPLIFSYFFFFGMTLMAHEQTADASQVEREFRGMLEGTGFEGYGGPVVSNTLPVSGHKSMDDIDVIDDVYTYLQDAVIPVYLFPTNGSNAVRKEDQARVLSYNRLIGGLQLMQTRKQRIPCEDAYPNDGPYNNSKVNPFLVGFDCFPDTAASADCFGPGADVEGFCPDKMWLDNAPDEPDEDNSTRRLNAAAHAAKARMGKRAKNAMSGDAAGERFSLTLTSFEGVDIAIQRLKQLQDNSWLDLQTSQVIIRMLVLNADLGMYCLVDVNVFFASSGELTPFVTATSFLAQPYAYASEYILDVLWFMLWLHVCWTSMQGLLEASKNAGPLSYFMEPLNVLEWLTACGGMAVFITWLAYLVRLSDVKTLIMKVAMAEPATLDYTEWELFEYRQATRKLFEQMASFIDQLETGRWYMASYIIFLIFRFFIAFEAQPRLAVITQTVLGCKSDFIHFFIVFMSMYASFSVAAMFLFGHRMIQFSDPWLAFCQNFEILLGSFAWDELGEEYPLTSFLWFTGFMVLIFNIMLNMILAIIMDVYGSAKQAASLSDPIWIQVSNMIHEYRTKVPLSSIISVLEELDNDWVGPNLLVENIPAMSKEQATAIVDTVNGVVANEEESALTLSDATRLIVLIRGHVHSIAKQMEAIRYIQKAGKELQKKALDPAIRAKVMPKKAPLWPARVVLEKLDPTTETQVRALEGRLRSLEGFLNEAMNYVVFRGKEWRQILIDLEAMLKSTGSSIPTLDNDPAMATMALEDPMALEDGRA